MCTCNKNCCDVVDSGIVHYSFTSRDLIPQRLEDGRHAFLKVLRQESPKELYVRFSLVDIDFGKMIGLTESDVLADEGYLQERANGILPFQVSKLEVQEPTKEEPILKVAAIIELLDGSSYELGDEISFEDASEEHFNAIRNCFRTEYRCVADQCYGQDWYRWCKYRCERRVCTCDGTWCGWWHYFSPYCGWWCR